VDRPIGGRPWPERAIALLLVVSLGVMTRVASDRRPVPHPPPLPLPMRVHTVPLPDSVWQVLLRDGHSTGRPDAGDTLVVFCDYECPACGSMMPLLDSLLAGQHPVVVLHRHFPLPNHRYAFEKAVAVECVARVGRMAEGQAMMYEQGGVPVEPVHLATRLGIDPEMMDDCWQRGEARLAVERDLALALALELRGTPSVFFAGSQWSHFPDLAQLLELVRTGG